MSMSHVLFVLVLVVVKSSWLIAVTMVTMATALDMAKTIAMAMGIAMGIVMAVSDGHEPGAACVGYGCRHDQWAHIHSYDFSTCHGHDQWA